MIKVSRTFHRCQYFLDEEEWEEGWCGVRCCKRKSTLHDSETNEDLPAVANGAGSMV